MLLQRDGDGRIVGTRWPHEIVRVFEVDGELLRGVPAPRAMQLRRQVTVDLLCVATGLSLPPTAGFEGAFGLLVLDGMLVRRVTLAGRGSVELLGAGDVLRPWQDDGSLASLPAETSWRALERTRLALLDDGFLALVQHFPSVLGELMARATQRSHVLLARLAIAQMPRLDARLLALFWHLADRWGHVEPGRVTVPVALSHAVLAELVSAQRPSVTVALRQLTDGGRIGRIAGGGWALYGPPPLLAAEAGAAEPVAVMAL